LRSLPEHAWESSQPFWRSHHGDAEVRLAVRSGAQWTGALHGPAFFAYATNYLIDTENAVIVDVEATRAIRRAEVGAARTMIDRTRERFGLHPKRLAGDSAYGAAPMLAWLVKERGITPHIPVFDKSKREDGTLSRADFTWDIKRGLYLCPSGKTLKTTGKVHAPPRDLRSSQWSGSRFRSVCNKFQIPNFFSNLIDSLGPACFG
jgi:hypothetical protein